MGGAFADPKVVAALPKHDIKGLSARMLSQAKTIDAACDQAASARPTTADTERLDLIDGAIITSLRACRTQTPPPRSPPTPSRRPTAA